MSGPIASTPGTRGSAVRAALLLALLGLLTRDAPAAPEERPPHGSGQRGAAEPAAAIDPEVLSLLRRFLSQDAREQARAEHALRRLGPAAAPHLRAWLERVHGEAEKVKDLLARLEGRDPAARDRETLTTRELFHQIVLECQGHLRDGKPENALPLAEAALLLDPAGPQAWELRRLARRARERSLTQKALEPVLEADKLVYELTERPRLTFRLHNHHATAARIRLHRGVLGEFDVLVTRRAIGGSAKLDKTTLHIQAPPEVDHILIAPGKAWKQDLDFKLDEPLPLTGLVVRVQVEGRFRPSEWAVEGIEDNIALSIGETEMWLVPPGEAAGCERPLEKLGAALVFGKVEPFFVGGQLAVWAGEQDSHVNEKVIDTIVSASAELEGARRDIAARLLQEATGKSFGPDLERWQAWWSRLRAAPR